jgi:hypothetical protein
MRITINAKVTIYLDETDPELDNCLLLNHYKREYSERAGVLRGSNCDAVETFLQCVLEFWHNSIVVLLSYCKH